MEFTSERKRMSIIVRDPDDGLIKLYCKGADSVILARLDDKLTDPDIQAKTESFLLNASTNGLRTLCLGMRILSEQDIQAFLKEIDIAEINLFEADELLEAAYNKLE